MTLLGVVLGQEFLLPTWGPYQPGALWGLPPGPVGLLLNARGLVVEDHGTMLALTTVPRRVVGSSNCSHYAPTDSNVGVVGTEDVRPGTV